MSDENSGRPGKVSQSDEEWRAKLTPEEYRVTRAHGTEPPWSGKLLENKDTGKYVCICCETELFSSSAKFDSGTGWPSFFEAVKVGDSSGTPSVETQPDTSNGKLRTEVLCRKCDAHLGHVYRDGPQPTGLRYCINSVSLQFKQE